MLIGLFAFYVTYELGRYDAGYDRQAVAQQRTELQVQIEHLEATNRQMRTRLAELDTIRVGRAHEQAEVARAMGDLQARVTTPSQELAFYRGVVAQGLRVKINQLRVTAGSGAPPSSWSRWCVPGAPTAGRRTVRLSLDGTADRRRQVARPSPPSPPTTRCTSCATTALPAGARPRTMVPLAFKPDQLWGSAKVGDLIRARAIRT